jgi:hypothetical protein
LVPLIVKADVEPKLRQRWLNRLWQALQDDEIPYLDLLGDYWGELCVTPELASHWANEFMPVVESIWSLAAPGHGYFKGTSACLASLYAAGRFDELLALIDRAPFKWWHNRQWGVKALAAMGKKAEAIRYAEDSRGLNDPGWQIAELARPSCCLPGWPRRPIGATPSQPIRARRIWPRFAPSPRSTLMCRRSKSCET